MKLYQQGDVLIQQIIEIPLKALKKEGKILAKGELTGHCHTITKGDADLYEYEGTLFLRINSNTAELTHPEHKTIVLPKGDFEIKRIREYDHFIEEAKKVQD